jgi:hypothetical protein
MFQTTLAQPFLAYVLFSLALVSMATATVAETCILKQTRMRSYSFVGLLRVARKVDRGVMPLAMAAYLWGVHTLPREFAEMSVVFFFIAATFSGLAAFARRGNIVSAALDAMTIGPYVATGAGLLALGMHVTVFLAGIAVPIAVLATALSYVRTQQNLEAWRD